MITPNQENLSSDKSGKEIYHFYDADSLPVFKTKEIDTNNRLFVFYPFSLNKSIGSIKSKRISVIEFRGWDDINKLPKAFKKTPGYGFNSPDAKQFFRLLYKKFPQFEKLVISLNGGNRFSLKTITLNFEFFNDCLKAIKKEASANDKSKRILVNNLLATATDKVTKIDRQLSSGELEQYLSKYDSFEKISSKDIDALTKILTDLPTTRVFSTAHIIKTRERIDTIYLDDVIAQYEKLLKDKEDHEESWQQFFQKHTWTLNHLFPYEVILHKGKAYVGGKTLENEDGRIVDFLFQNEFKDNFALLEIKTPKKQLLKNTPYRQPSVFAASDELSGGINQCLDQKDTFLKEFGNTYKTLDPKLILIIGRKKQMNAHQVQCFELFRANQKNVDIVTFDELQSKLLGLYAVITGKKI